MFQFSMDVSNWKKIRKSNSQTIWGGGLDMLYVANRSLITNGLDDMDID